ncbi:MAG: hypothetical protein IPO92_10370 [Saprospiraceae bacterium]|nr:hypothetical protein [Saprospiraceae bacterium]
MVKKFNNTLLDDEARQLSGRFSHIDRENNLGLLKNEDYNLEINNIQWAMLDLLRRYEKGELMTTIGKGNGRFVHNIPSRMEKKWRLYVVSE